VEHVGLPSRYHTARMLPARPCDSLNVARLAEDLGSQLELPPAGD
jgi:hypothetical protein